jgi:hypothetical protein
VIDMDTINCQTRDAVAPVRTLPWIDVPTSRWQSMPGSMTVGAQAPVVGGLHATTMLAAGTYLVADLPITTEIDVRVLRAGADHKFSTRLGPTASPPV